MENPVWEKKLSEPLLPRFQRTQSRIRIEVQEKKSASPQNFVAALLCSFLSVTGGVALGGYIFPSDDLHPNARFQVAGMQIGLLAATASSWFAYLKSGVFCGVPGGIFPPVIALGSTYFKSIGPENPCTIMFALPLLTFLQGVLLYFVARLPLEKIVKGIPYVVFCGFLAGTGVVCIQGGLEMAAGAPVTSEQFWNGPSHWLPSLLVAVIVYACQQLDAPLKELLFPASLLLLALIFYIGSWFYYGTIDLASARRNGYLYKFEVPSSPSFYQVWTLQDFGSVQWDIVLDSSFLTALINSFALSVLCIVEDLYGVIESTGLKVNFEKELENTALMNIVCGLIGAMPTNLVMSYSVTAHRSGAKSRRFLLYLSIISTFFFLMADYILSLTPIMVPAAALVWVGIAMCWDMIYHGIKRLSKADYAIVWMMVVLDVTKGPDDMLIAGLCVTCLQLAYRLSAIKVFDAEHTSVTERSTTMYPLGKDAILQKHGSRVLILHLAKGLLFFGSAFQIQERVERHLNESEEEERLRILILDLTQIEDSEISGIKVLYFIMNDLAVEHGFDVICVGLQDNVEEQLAGFCGNSDSLNRPLPKKERKKMNDVLRYAENQLFDYCIKGGEILEGTNKNPNLSEVRSFVKSLVGNSEFFPVASDVHSWLNNYTKEYEAKQVLPCLVSALVCKRFSRGDHICVTSSNADNINEELAERSPIIWVLSGRVDLLYGDLEMVDKASTIDLVKTIESTPSLALGRARATYDRKNYVENLGAGRAKRTRGDILQIAEVGEASAHAGMCAGPLDTFRHFFGAFQQPAATARVESEEATVAMLYYSKFDSMQTHQRNTARLLEHYFAKKRFSHQSMSRR